MTEGDPVYVKTYDQDGTDPAAVSTVNSSDVDADSFYLEDGSVGIVGSKRAVDTAVSEFRDLFGKWESTIDARMDEGKIPFPKSTQPQDSYQIQESEREEPMESGSVSMPGPMGYGPEDSQTEVATDGGTNYGNGENFMGGPMGPDTVSPHNKVLRDGGSKAETMGDFPHNPPVAGYDGKGNEPNSAPM